MIISILILIFDVSQEMLGYYTMAQTSFLLFMSVIVAMAVCMAWRVADDELAERLVSSQSCLHK